MGWWDLDSQGWQGFNISLVNATIGFNVDLSVVGDDADPSRPSICPGQEGDAVMTGLGFPLAYDDINFRFDKLGAFANTMVNGVGVYFLQSQEDLLIEKAKGALQQFMSTLICRS